MSKKRTQNATQTAREIRQQRTKVEKTNTDRRSSAVKTKVRTGVKRWQHVTWQQPFSNS